MNTFKKTLIGVSVLAASSASFGASITPTTVPDPSPQAITTDAAVSTGTFKFAAAADYGTGDTISFTFDQDVDSTQVWSTTTLVGATCAAGDDEISFAGYSNKVATYIFGLVTGSTIGCTWTMPAVAFDGAAVAAADTVKVTAATSRGFGTLEAVAATTLIDVSAAQFGLTVTGLGGVVDVESGRKTWVDDSTTMADADGADTEDTLTIQLTDTTKAATLQNTSTVTVTADMTWAKFTAANGTVTYPGVLSAPGTAVISDTGITYTQATAAASSIKFGTTAGTLPTTYILPNQSYAVTAAVAYKDSNATPALQSVALAKAGGAWTLNGASITAYGISNSPSVTPMLWVQNGGASNGNISATVFCNGITIPVTGLGTASPKANTKVGEAIQAAVDANGNCPTVNTRYDATVTVNAPKADITLNASYKVTAADGATDRVMLETSDSLPATSDAAN